MPRNLMRKILFGLVWLGVVLAACQHTPEATQAPATTTMVPTATALPSPTPTATPAPPTAVLWAGPEAAPALREPAWAWVQSLAQDQGFVPLQRQPGEDLPPNVQVIVAVEAAPPNTDARILAIAPPSEVEEAVQKLDPTPADLAHRAFLAGYLSAVITKDWRIAMLATENEAQAAQAFEDGGRYFCGLCRPLYPPFVVYPAYALLPPESDAAAWQAAVQRLQAAAVHTFVLSPEAMQANVAQDLPNNVVLIALDSPEDPTRYAASIAADVQAGLDALWQDPALASTPVPMRLDVYDAGAISPGRQRLAEEVMHDLEAGFIAP